MRASSEVDEVRLGSHSGKGLDFGSGFNPSGRGSGKLAIDIDETQNQKKNTL